MDSSFFFFFCLTPIHVGSCSQGVVVWGPACRRQSCQVSHLCQGAVKKKENLACYYYARAGHNCMPMTVTLALCWSPGSPENRGWQTSSITPPSLLSPQGSSLPPFFLAHWPRLQRRSLLGNRFQLDTAPAKVCFPAIMYDTTMKASLSTFIP